MSDEALVDAARDPDETDAPGRRSDHLTGAWRRLSRSHLRTAAVGLAGASAAAASAYFIGCRTGSCPLTSNVWTAALYGSVVGGVVGWPVRSRGPSERG
jgi:hypothetical protein